MRKYVLTGGACCGKTTLINELECRGHSVLHEVAREVLEERRKRNVSQKEWVIRQKLIFERQLERERVISGPAFLDRGIVDSLAYSKVLLGYTPKRFADFNFKNLYDKIFILDRLPFVEDGLRIEEDGKMANHIHNELIKLYEEFDYEIIFIPPICVEKRANCVLSYIQRGHV